MTITAAAVLVFYGGTLASGQSTTEKQSCYEQSRKYVKDLNDGENPQAVFVTKWTWRGAHFDPKTQVCYVHVDRGTKTNTNPTLTEKIDDAFEGKTHAVYEGGIDLKNPETCHVNGKVCRDHEEFNKLSYEFIPAWSKAKESK